MRRLAAIAALIAIALTLRAVARPAGAAPVRAAIRALPETGVERGRLVYERCGCALCHGPEGGGGFANPNAETAGKVPGPFGPIEMGGMFTVVKIREDLLSYDDPGWYDYRNGTVAHKVDGPATEPHRPAPEHHGHDPR